MSETKIWRVSGTYKKKKREYRFNKELLADREAHVREKILSDLGSRHRVKRKSVVFDEIVEIKPEEVTDLDLRRLLGVESDI